MYSQMLNRLDPAAAEREDASRAVETRAKVQQVTAAAALFDRTMLQTKRNDSKMR